MTGRLIGRQHHTVGERAMSRVLDGSARQSSPVKRRRQRRFEA